MTKRYKINYLHLPTEHRAKGSPTTITKLRARVTAVFMRRAEDKNPNCASSSSSLSSSSSSSNSSFPACRKGHFRRFRSFSSLTQVLRVRTVLKIMTRNCFPEWNYANLLCFHLIGTQNWDIIVYANVCCLISGRVTEWR
jgi:hypothetical protein